MSVKRFTIDGYGQIELNNVAFRRDGRIEAQCKLDSATGKDFASVPAENGMLLAVDKANGIVRFPEDSEALPVALHYSTEHMYDERTPGLKNFKLEKDSFLPRMGYLAVGDIFTSNCLSYDSDVWSDDDAVKTAVAACATTAVYGGIDSTYGAIRLGSSAGSYGPILKAVAGTIMPDGQYAVKFQCIKA